MKKLASLFVTSALALGVALVAPAAQAADPYPQSVTTSCAVVTNTPIVKGQTARVRVSWTSAGNAKPAGTLVAKVVRRKTGEVVRGGNGEYTGKVYKFEFNRLQPGAYRIRVQGVTSANSVFKGCSARAFIRVTR